jgi:DNA integrity scanning protein DisA with diadenylate cyclase activity
MNVLRVRRVDAKGRVYLSKELKGLELYMAELDGVILLSTSRERILSAVEQLAPRNA